MPERDIIYSAPPEQVVEALRQAILARGYEITRSDSSAIYFRSGRRYMSGTASPAADGQTVLSLAGVDADQLHPQVADQLGLSQVSTPSGTSEAPAVPAQVGPRGDAPFTAEGRNGQLTVTPTKIVISRRGVKGFLTQGHKGEKEIAIDQISSVQFKKNGLATAGYISVAFVGGQETKQGMFDAVSDENSIVFGKKAEANFLHAKDLIEKYRELRRIPAPVAIVHAPPSGAGLDDLERLADFRDRGIITPEEFEAKKREILGL